MRDIHNALKVTRVIDPKAVGTSGIAGGQLSAVLDTKGYDANEFVIAYGTSASAADKTTAVLYESAATGSGFTSVADADMLGTELGASRTSGALTSGATINMVKKLGYIGNKRYLKLRLYGTGHATGIVSAVLIQAKASREPVA